MESQTKTLRSERFDLRTLYETSRLLSASLDLTFVSNNLLLTAMSKLLTTRGAVWLYEEEEDAYVVRSAKGTKDIWSCRLPGYMTPDAVVADSLVPTLMANHRIKIVAPISFGKRRIGLLGLGGKATGQEYGNEEIEFVSSLVNMSSAAIHNSLIVEELRSANRSLDGKIQQLNTLFDLSTEFNSTVDRTHLVKLLSFALMGQMLVSRHLYLMRLPENEDGEDDFRVEVISARGVKGADLPRGIAESLCRHVQQFAVSSEECQIVELQEWLTSNGLELVLPLKHQGETAGVLCLGPKATGDPFTAADTEFLYSLGNLSLVSLQNSFLVDQQIEKERLEEEMRLARQIQEKLQPSTLPKVVGADMAIIAIPSRHVAGDYLDIVELTGDRLLLAIGDVTGKGMPASLLMSNVQACLHVLLPLDMTLEEATAHMNRVIVRNTGFDKFITYFHGIYSPAERSFEYVNAGHNPPTILRANGDVELLETGGLLLGVMDLMPYERGHTTLARGDVLAMFTDGVTEAMSVAEEEYGEDRLIEALRRFQDHDADGILKGVVDDIEQFTQGTEGLSDDLTMIVVKMVE